MSEEPKYYAEPVTAMMMRIQATAEKRVMADLLAELDGQATPLRSAMAHRYATKKLAELIDLHRALHGESPTGIVVALDVAAKLKTGIVRADGDEDRFQGIPIRENEAASIGHVYMISDNGSANGYI